MLIQVRIRAPLLASRIRRTCFTSTGASVLSSNSKFFSAFFNFVKFLHSYEKPEARNPKFETSPCGIRLRRTAACCRGILNFENLRIVSNFEFRYSDFEFLLFEIYCNHFIFISCYVMNYSLLTRSGRLSALPSQSR